MTNADTTALIERIARAIHLDDLAAGEAEPWGADEYLMAWYRRNATAVLPIVAVEVRKAKAEALREAADGLLENIDWSDGRSSYGDNDGYEASARELRARAAEYETGDQA